MRNEHEKSFLDKIDASAILTILGIVVLFSSAVIVTLIAPRYADKAWTQPSSYYQVQMYEVADPRIFFSSSTGKEFEYVHQIKDEESLLAFVETELLRIISSKELEKYITRFDEQTLKLTPKLLLLRPPEKEMLEKANQLRKNLQSKSTGLKIDYDILELYEPEGKEAFAIAPTEGYTENFVRDHFEIVDNQITRSYMKDLGVIFIKNPQAYRVSLFQRGGSFGWKYDPNGEPVTSIQQLRNDPLSFRSRKELIQAGEKIFAEEGCYYCHSDQTRTLVQDVVLNGTETYPAPPSAPNEYIYQNITFPGTRRIGPDLSRVGIKRSNRDWHKSHFWQPRTESPGSIMPSFKHFFDFDPSITTISEIGVPNYKFEAVFQYLMTKGTRITPPDQAWWLGKDPVRTLEIIDGRK